MSTRHILLHYHLFKNAGTSIDRLLQESYGEQWKNYDKDKPGAKISGAEIQLYLEDNPALVALSSHQIVPPVPRGDFSILPIVFLRDPVDRIKSAWLFEWQKQPGLSTPKGSLSDYILEKFKPRSGSVIANFQVSRLSNSEYNNTIPVAGLSDHDRLHQAMAFLRQCPFFGIVDRFDDSLRLLADATRHNYPELECKAYKENVSQSMSVSLAEKYAQLQHEIGNEMYNTVLQRNALDLQLYSYALGLFDSRLALLENSGQITPASPFTDAA